MDLNVEVIAWQNSGRKKPHRKTFIFHEKFQFPIRVDVFDVTMTTALVQQIHFIHSMELHFVSSSEFRRNGNAEEMYSAVCYCFAHSEWDSVHIYGPK